MPSQFFQHQQSRFVESLNLNIESYRHSTGARHYHLATEDDNQVFMVALRTLAKDSTGVAHILEHTVLCGSQRYPVRDPFFLMLRRSLSNFMNAFTASDWTAYPFATQNLKDYQNLLKVYLDAVFFPNLNELDFMQEGWRHDWQDQQKPELGLCYKGVVFNEMKGAMSSPIRQLWRHLCAELYTDSTYHHNSGGNPENIPDLSYQQLLDFHATYYHPSNAVFFTYGNQSARYSQELVQEHLFKRRSFAAIEVPKIITEKRLRKPVRVLKEYPLEEANLDHKTHIVMAWLLPENNCNQQALLEAHLVSTLLFDNASSPLRQCLEESDLGLSPSPLCGLDDDHFEMLMVAGLEGAEAHSEQAIESLIMNQLERLAREGFEPCQVAACMHQLELSQRDISSGSMPYGLNLILSATAAAVHEADVVSMLAIDEPLKQLAQRVKQKHFCQDLIKRLLLDNPHRVTLVMKPSKHRNQQITKNEKQRLSREFQRLSSEELQQIKINNQRLSERQQQIEDESCLPTVDIDDIETDSLFSKPLSRIQNHYCYVTNCNGLDYMQFYSHLDLSSLDQASINQLPILTALLGELGQGTASYIDSQNKIALYTGGIGFTHQVWQPLLHQGNQHPFYLRLVGSTKGLHTNRQNMLDLLNKALREANLSEHRYIRDLVTQMMLASFNQVTSSGHLLAMQSASSHFSTRARLAYHWNGLKSIQQLIALNRQLETTTDQFFQQLEYLNKQLIKSAELSQSWVFISDQRHYQALKALLDLTTNGAGSAPLFDVSGFKPSAAKLVWETESSVNYCAQAYASVGIADRDAGALMVLAQYLKNGYLHTAIREQGGAYGGGAQYDPASQTFRFFSYRDPRCLQTFASFNESIEWMLKQKPDTEQIRQAILSVCARLSAPMSPPQQVKADHLAFLNGFDKSFRDSLRKSVIEVDWDALRRVAQTYLYQRPSAQTVLTNKQTAADLSTNHGFSVEPLYL